MATATLDRPVEPGAGSTPAARTPRAVPALGLGSCIVLGIWILVWCFTKGNDTLALLPRDSRQRRSPSFRKDIGEFATPASATAPSPRRSPTRSTRSSSSSSG